ncbi:CRISPR-associated helicase/endonuclease Cas3 [Balneatrix alpica]|uniref:CRISPR-associated helicase/endonuclease Cas3 n=1 Tax=Balneatrix alpica TaxID=75684 RepID=UPI002738B8CC|nr:CRISPR-associated helicase/endonuclease Cas3 [Balneatrix alpica]
MLDDLTLLSRYWGKARKPEEQAGEAYHLLPYHCLDVASVAAYWWDHSPALRHLFCMQQIHTEAEVRAWVLFFIALHDLGKFDIRFQCKARASWRALNPADQDKRLPTLADCKGYDHGASGLYWLMKDYEPEQLDDGFGLAAVAAHPYTSWQPWLEAVCGHHGTLRTYADVNANTTPLFDVSPLLIHRDKAARRAWLTTSEALFLAPQGVSIASPPPRCSLLLAGFCAISDWLGSMLTEDTFLYCAKPGRDTREWQHYYQQRYQHDARKVLQRSGMLAEVNPQADIQSLLEPGHRPRQLQVLVDELPVAAGLTLIEAPTGSGKTETALAYAWRLLEHNLADSIIFALPTQATANAMLARMEHLAPILFAHPNLVLSHGNARFNETFQAIRQAGRNLQGEHAWSQCCDWISQSRKRVFLGQIGVCTIDQVLVSVLPLRHRFVRGFGVGRSVLIVDEVHAYDRYMYGLLEAVLQDQARVGSPVVLLSATLPEKQKQLLLQSYAPDLQRSEQGSAVAQPYPLISWAAGQQLQHFHLLRQEQHQPPPFSLQLQTHYAPEANPDESLLQALRQAASAGAQVCLICNRVDVAQQAYLQLQHDLPAGVELHLFHARFSLLDRRIKEQAALTCFGVKGVRHPGRILVATQVVEQSLDVDFDWLVTQLCPVDLLFQRLGRLHRHARQHRPQGFESPRATVLLPVEEGYGVLGKIYSHTRVMWRTQKWIEALAANPLRFPDAYRQWIEPIYREEADEDEPLWVREGMEKFEQEVFTKLVKAKQMRKWAEYASLVDSDANERAVTRDGAQSIALVPYVQTAAGRRLLDGVSIYEDLDEYRQQEALALNQVSVPESWRRWLTVEPDQYQRYWLEAMQDVDSLLIPLQQGSLRYSKERGMEKEHEPVN